MHKRTIATIIAVLLLCSGLSACRNNKHNSDFPDLHSADYVQVSGTASYLREEAMLQATDDAFFTFADSFQKAKTICVPVDEPEGIFGGVIWRAVYKSQEKTVAEVGVGWGYREGWYIFCNQNGISSYYLFSAKDPNEYYHPPAELLDYLKCFYAVIPNIAITDSLTDMFEGE